MFSQTLGNCVNVRILDIATSAQVTDISFILNIVQLNEFHMEYSCKNADSTKATLALTEIHVNFSKLLILRLWTQFFSDMLIDIATSLSSFKDI